MCHLLTDVGRRRRRRKIPTGQKFSSSVEKDAALRAGQKFEK